MRCVGYIECALLNGVHFQCAMTHAESHFNPSTPQALSMGIHESQSLLWERMVGLSQPFCTYLLPKLHESFPDALPSDKRAADLYAAINKVWGMVGSTTCRCSVHIVYVSHHTRAFSFPYFPAHTLPPPPCHTMQVKEPSFIRVEADEVSYPLHIILRYELERGLLSGDIAVEDLPKLWNEKMVQYLGVAPPTDAQGVLQDVHWSMVWGRRCCCMLFACTLYRSSMHPIPLCRVHLATSPPTHWAPWQRCRFLMQPAKTSPTCLTTWLQAHSPHFASGSTKKCTHWAASQQAGTHCWSWRQGPPWTPRCTCNTSLPSTRTFTSLPSRCFTHVATAAARCTLTKYDKTCPHNAKGCTKRVRIYMMQTMKQVSP